MNRDWGNELCDDSVDVFWFRICIHSGIRGQESGVMRCERHHMIVKEVSDYAGKNDGSPNLKQGHLSTVASGHEHELRTGPHCSESRI
jgi:hypothetical protein